MTAAAPRVLHIVENLNTGAVENWLVRMLVHAAAKGVRLDWTFYCTLAEPGRLDEAARAAGARIINSPVPMGQKTAFVRALRKTLRQERYDVVHCHHDLVSALYLAAAAGLPIRRRLIHIHNADEIVLTPNPLKQLLLREPLRRIGLALADRIVGISHHTLDTFLAGRKRRAGRDLVHYYGIDPAAFSSLAVDPVQFRKTIDLPSDALILLFGGRIVPEKNPVFTVEILAELIKREPRAFAVFAGAGSLEGAVMDRARALGVEDRIRMIGWRTDLPAVMTACDWFVLPRPEEPKEGFGIAVVEAQLAGLAMLLSRGVPDDPLLPSARYRLLGLAEGPQAWANAAMELKAERPAPREKVLADLAASPMDMDKALDGLRALHD